MTRMAAMLTLAMTLATGCSLQNAPIVRGEVAVMPNGDRIALENRYDGKGRCEGPFAVWIRSDKSERTLITVAPSRGSGAQPTPDLAGATVRTAGSGKVWLVKGGQALASFDLDKNLAIIGPFAQPSWATAE